MSATAILGEDVVIELRGETARLRPTLGAAMAACCLADGFGGLAAKVDELDTETCAGLIAGGLGVPRGAARPWGTIAELAGLRSTLLDFVDLLACGGERETPDADEPPSQSKPISHERYFEMLFEIATGWLGWSVDEALASPMPAILAARRGRIDLARAIFGGGPAEANDIPLDQKVRAIMAMRGTRKVAAS